MAFLFSSVRAPELITVCGTWLPCCLKGGSLPSVPQRTHKFWLRKDYMHDSPWKQSCLTSIVTIQGDSNTQSTCNFPVLLQAADTAVHDVRPSSRTDSWEQTVPGFLRKYPEMGWMLEHSKLWEALDKHSVKAPWFRELTERVCSLFTAIAREMKNKDSFSARSHKE